MQVEVFRLEIAMNDLRRMSSRKAAGCFTDDSCRYGRLDAPLNIEQLRNSLPVKQLEHQEWLPIRCFGHSIDLDNIAVTQFAASIGLPQKAVSQILRDPIL